MNSLLRFPPKPKKVTAPSKPEKGGERGGRRTPLIPYKNFYEVIPKSILASIPKITYANEKIINIKLPSGIVIVGSTGGGKTNWLIHFLSLVDSFDRVTIYAKNNVEPLYAFLIKSLHDAGIECDVFDNLDDVIPALEYDSKKNNCVIIDDFMNAPPKALEKISDLFTAGRKTNVTPIWITQSWFKGTPQAIRLNASYTVIFKLKSRGDAKRICVNSALDTEPKELVEMLTDIQSGGQGQFMLIDKATDDPELKVRYNWGDKVGDKWGDSLLSLPLTPPKLRGKKKSRTDRF